VHACEQTREVEECIAEHGMTPIALLHACGALGTRTTVVHGTHLTDADVELLAKTRATVCLTPSTERNLGDGLCRIADLHARGVALCVGTDSHARTDLVDELRGVEEQERLRVRRRNVLTPLGGRLAGALVPIGSAHGLRALGLENERARVLVAMPLEGRAGDAAAGVDAWLVAGTARDVIDVDGIDGAPLVRNGALKRVSAADIEAGALAALRALTAPLR
jgi:cytosine/adenosine deaminase-related metal-dependent hydrolase